jgi:hypothetical protein
MQDPVILRLAERRRNAQRLIQRGTAIVERGQAELAECDRFERFYLEAKGDPADREFLTDPNAINRAIVGTDSPGPSLMNAIRAQITLKQAIVNVLKEHPEGLESGDLLTALRESDYPNLLRTSMSPQLSRMKGNEVANVHGRWTLTENKKAAEAKAIGGIFD